MIASLPKAPSRINPIANPKRALIRRNWVLSRMESLGYIDEDNFLKAINEPISAFFNGIGSEVEADYLAEQIRRYMIQNYGLSAYKEGYKVYSTLNSSYQTAAVNSLRRGIESYESRHGFRKPENYSELIPDDFIQRTDLFYKVAYDPNNFKDEFGIKKDLTNPFQDGILQKPVIAAVNGFAMGGGFMLVERCDLRIAVKEAIFEMSEAKRWLLGGYNHGHYGNLPHPVATEMAFGYRINAERMYQVGFVNRLVDQENLMEEAHSMAKHLLSLPPASRVNTLYMMKHMAPKLPSNITNLAEKLHLHGDTEDRMESRRAFAEKREPNYKGWLNPDDRYNMPKLEEE